MKPLFPLSHFLFAALICIASLPARAATPSATGSRTLWTGYAANGENPPPARACDEEERLFYAKWNAENTGGECHCGYRFIYAGLAPVVTASADPIPQMVEDDDWLQVACER